MTVLVWQLGILTVKTRQAEETGKVTNRVEFLELRDALKRLVRERLLHEVTHLGGAKKNSITVCDDTQASHSDKILSQNKDNTINSLSKETILINGVTQAKKTLLPYWKPRVIGDIATVFKWALHRRVRGRSTFISYTTIMANKCEPRGCDGGKRCLAANRLSSPSCAGLLLQQGKENTFLPQIYERNLTTIYCRQNRA